MMIPSKNDQILIQKILVNPSPIYFINNKITKKRKEISLIICQQNRFSK